ncbi:SCO family protein [Sulfurimonas sp.]|uniref:SCO family protein n=1 Tax=Sulfurimonas sp. TaxID=2022749 RepID=UPI0025FCED9A|nr:SCO family protein [Sulfurimonas sp.]MBT5935277.1 SCO family protein [Sulfurimonas sp.]
MRKFLLVLSLLFSFSNADTLGIQEKLGNMVPLDLTFLNEESKSVTLKELMDGKPTILTLNYFRCAGICTPQLNDLAKMLSRLDLAENTDYKVLTVSFAEDETPDLAKSKRKNQLASMSRAYVADAWHFVIGENNSSGVLAEKVGFVYEKTVSEAGKVDYIHAAALIILSPEGKITRYLNGIEQLPFDAKMALVEASDGKVGPTIAKTLLYCFAYDPKGKTYIFVWEKIAAIVMLTLVFGFFIYLVKSGRKEEDHQKKGEENE